jgi:hypothetical protein
MDHARFACTGSNEPGQTPTALAARPRPDVGDLRERVREDFDALLPVLAVAGEQAEPVVIRDASGFRIWTLTEDEDGEWWGWSWREEDEEWKPVRADRLRYPVTILHAPDAVLATLPDSAATAPVVSGEAEWVDGLPNDGEWEYTISSACDGSNVQHHRRRPRYVRQYGPWEPTTREAFDRATVADAPEAGERA